MAETSPTTSELNAKSGIVSAATGFKYPTKGTGPDFYPEWADNLDRLEKSIGPLGLRVYRDGVATFGVYPGKLSNGDTMVSYAGASAQALTVNQTNYIYLTAAGTLTVNTTGFPVPSATPHIPLASIVVGATDFDETIDITDYRARAIFNILSGLTPALANTALIFFSVGAAADILTGGTSADALHIHDPMIFEEEILCFDNEILWV